MKNFTEASTEVIHVAEDLIKKDHPNLVEARIAFVFQDEATQSDGRFELAKTSKVPPKMQPMMEYDFLVVIAKDRWGALSSNAREALIDHELCHCGGDDLNGWKMRHHDIEEFREVLERHGAWNAGLSKDLRSIMQPGLPGTETVTLSTDKGKVATLTGQQLAVISKKVSVFKDELLDEVRKFKAEKGEISISSLQRKFKIGYPRAAKLMELIETAEAVNEP
jgi:hypothetical protein